MNGWAPIIEGIDLVPADNGRFEVSIDGAVIFSKKALGRHAEPGEVVRLARTVMGPELDWR